MQAENKIQIKSRILLLSLKVNLLSRNRFPYVYFNTNEVIQPKKL